MRTAGPPQVTWSTPLLALLVPPGGHADQDIGRIDSLKEDNCVSSGATVSGAAGRPLTDFEQVPPAVLRLTLR